MAHLKMSSPQVCHFYFNLRERQKARTIKRNKNGYRYQRAAQRQREIQTRQWAKLLREYRELLRNPRS